MNLSCGNKTIKYLMFVFNFIFVITGIIILALGVSVKAYYYPYDAFLDDKYFSLPNMLIATGTFIFLISFLGCYGAMKENWVMLMAFSILLAIIFIFELSIGIAGYVLRDKTADYLQTKLLDTMQQYNSSQSISNMWDLIQTEFECCGALGPSDWQGVFNNSELPISCCPSAGGTVGAFYCNAYTSSPTASTKPTETTTATPSTPSTTTTAPKQDVQQNLNASMQLLAPASLVKEGETPVTGEVSSTAAVVELKDDPSADSSSSTVTTSTETSTTTKTTTTETPTSTSTVTSSTNPSTVTTPTSESSTNVTPSTAYPPSSTTPYSTGCKAGFGSFIKAHAVDIGGVGIALAVLQLIGIIFSFHLARQLKNGYYST